MTRIQADVWRIGGIRRLVLLLAPLALLTIPLSTSAATVTPFWVSAAASTSMNSRWPSPSTILIYRRPPCADP